MRILFIYPNLYAQIGFNYGVAFLSAVLKKAGHETKLLNINDKLGFYLDHDRIKKEVLNFDPELIAFSVVTNQYQFAKNIASEIRKYHDAPILCGGIHPTMDPEGVLNSGEFDFVCMGEGEGALCDLAGNINSTEEIKKIKNIWMKDNGLIIKNPMRELVDLSTLPRKDYEIFDFQKMIDAKDGWVGLMTSRGCPFRCTYCLNHKIVKMYQDDLQTKKINYMRCHSVEDVISEIDFVLRNYDRIKMFIFDDDLFTFNKEYVEDFCRQYKKYFRVPFVCNAHVKVFDDSIAQGLKDAGCQIVKFGLESGSDRVRSQIMRRFMKNEDIEKAFASAEKAGLHSSAFVMMGLPSESDEELQETIDLLGRIKPGRFRWAIFFPFINTEAYDITKNLGLINEEKINSLANFTEESCLNLSDQVYRKVKCMQKIFPWYVNASSNLEVAPLYKNLVEIIENLSEDEWVNIKDNLRRIDEDLSKVLDSKGCTHYRIKYNSFTGVRSDWID